MDMRWPKITLVDLTFSTHIEFHFKLVDLSKGTILYLIC